MARVSSIRSSRPGGVVVVSSSDPPPCPLPARALGDGGHERAGGGGAVPVLGGARGVPSGGGGQLPQRLQRRLYRLARRLPALLRQRMHGRSRSVFASQLLNKQHTNSLQKKTYK